MIVVRALFNRSTKTSTPPAFVGRVFAKGAIPTTTKVFFAVNPVAILGTEAESKPGVLTVDSSTTVLVYVLGTKAPVAGDHLICRFVGYRWVAERFGADEARRAGVVTEVVAPGKAYERALEVATRLAALPRDAVTVTKQAIDAASHSPREAALLIERLAYAALAQTQAARDAAAGFGRQ